MSRYEYNKGVLILTTWEDFKSSYPDIEDVGEQTMKFCYDETQLQAAQNYVDNYNSLAFKRIDVKGQMYKAFNDVKKNPDTTNISTGGVTFLFNQDWDDVHQVEILVTPTFKEGVYVEVVV